jgi:ribosomal protein S18 acetylase RimI-like enzyme
MLVSFDSSHAPEILRWPRGAPEFSAWAALDAPPDASVFATWHADEDIAAYVLLEDGSPVAYGEIWSERAERSVEFARILVAPAHRRRGVGARLMRLLLERAAADWVDAFWVRVVPGNRPALGLYRALGFEPVPEARQHTLNATQKRRYVWLRRG